MKFSIDSNTLVGALSQAVGIAGGPTLPILSGVRLEVKGDRVEITATDLEATVRTSLPVDKAEDGVVVVPGRRLLDVLKTQPKATVTLSTKDGKVKIANGRFRSHVNAMAADDYPAVTIPTEFPIELPAQVFIDCLEQTLPAVADKKARSGLAGVNIARYPEGLIFTGTDSYRIHTRTLHDFTGDEAAVTVPTRSAQLAAKAAADAVDIGVSLTPTLAAFRCGDTTITSRVIEDKFPDVAQYVDQFGNNENCLTVNRKDLIQAVRAVAAVGRGVTAQQKWTLGEEGITVDTTAQDVGDAKQLIEAEYAGEPMTVGVNPDYAEDALDAFSCETLTIRFADPWPSAFYMGDGDLKVLVVPMRLT